jgi:hypothetical protein
MAPSQITGWRRNWPIVVALCLLSFSVYYLSLAPTITWQHDGADSGDLATAVAVGGVPHPSGYPTYLLLAGFFNRLPLGGDVAYRLNIMSAICAAAAVGLLSLAVLQTLPRLLQQESMSPGFVQVSVVVASLTFAFSAPFWSQAVIAEVYALNALLVALLLWLALQVRAGSQRYLGWLCLAIGLALGNHLSVIFMFPLILALVGPACWQQGLGHRLGLFFLIPVGLSVYGIIPWRAAAQPPVNWGGAYHWDGFYWLVTGQAYREYVFGLPWAYVGDRMLALVQIIVRSLVWGGLPVAIWGWRLMARYDRLLAVSSLLTVGLTIIYAVGYNTADSYLYLLPALMFMSLWLAWGLLDLLSQSGSYLQGTRMAWGLLLLPAMVIVLNFSSMSLSRDRAALDFAQETLNHVSPDAIILVDDDRHTFALWYARYALGQRADVTIVNANLLGYSWYQTGLAAVHSTIRLAHTVDDLIRQNIDRHSVYAVGDTLTLPEQYRVEAVVKSQPLRRLNAKP